MKKLQTNVTLENTLCLLLDDTIKTLKTATFKFLHDRLKQMYFLSYF